MSIIKILITVLLIIPHVHNDLPTTLEFYTSHNNYDDNHIQSY